MAENRAFTDPELRYRVCRAKGNLSGSACRSGHPNRGHGHSARYGSLCPSATILTNVGESKPFVRNVFTLNTCAHIVGSQVLEFKDERQLLLEWRKFVEKADPDVIIGYNISNFDLPYLLDRARALKVPEFGYLGRLVGRSGCR